MCELPLEVDGKEKIVRAVFEGHVNKGQTAIKPRLFRPKNGTDEVSVIRADYRDADFCKAQGKQLAANAANAYLGLAIVFVAAIRACGSDVHDSREVYCAHADISHGITPAQPNEPLSAAQLKALDDRTEQIRDLAVFHKDPDASALAWTGPAL
jgi:hypothetical protein